MGHISWDKFYCVLISSDKRNSTSDKGEFFYFQHLLLYYFLQSKAIFIAVKVKDRNLQKVILVLLLNSCCVLFCFGCLIVFQSLHKDTDASPILCTHLIVYVVWEILPPVKRGRLLNGDRFITPKLSPIRGSYCMTLLENISGVHTHSCKLLL